MLAKREVVEDIECYMPDKVSTEKIARFFALFADCSRVRMLSALSIHPLCVSDLASVLQMNQTTVSHQLRLLRSVGIVDYERHGKVLFYKITNKKINDVLLVGVESLGY